jgi:uncharacterized damage-inducible protein DinB
MPVNELEQFMQVWERETESTLKLLRALPAAQYDFRPDKGGRSLGELAWHLAEGDAYMTWGIEKGGFSMDVMNQKPPNIARPREIAALAPAFEVVHKDAVARIKKLTPADLDRKIEFFGGPLEIRNILWEMVIHHTIHHRGQLSLMCRLAGGATPGMYGPNREEMAAMQAKASGNA